jgi:Cu2+-containing amine oxidase
LQVQLAQPTLFFHSSNIPGPFIMGAAFVDLPHPFDPLTLSEIDIAVTTVKKAHGNVFFNVVSLQEPRKAEMTAWLAEPDTAPRPKRMVDVTVITPGGRVYDGLVDLAETKIIKWELLDGEQPIVSISGRIEQQYQEKEDEEEEEEEEEKRKGRKRLADIRLLLDHYRGAAAGRARCAERRPSHRAVQD